MMKRMGINQVDIPAVEVIIKTEDKEIVISEPSVAKVNMMGQETFQISGNVTERESSSEPEVTEDDISTVVEQTGASSEDAEKALQENKGDIAAAIISLKN